jgi:hypothetical protein
MASFSFDTSTVAPRENNYELLPAGWYVAQITFSEIVDLKSGNGKAIKLTFEVLSEGYRGRKIWAQLNVRHNNQQAEQIAQQQLRELCDSLGIVRMNDTAELHNKPIQIKVKVRKSENPQYEDQNDISGYKTAGGASAPSMMIPPRSAAPAASAPAASLAPWAKKNAA